LARPLRRSSDRNRSRPRGISITDQDEPCKHDSSAPSTPLSATSGVDCSRQPRSPHFVVALDNPLSRNRLATSTKSPFVRRTRASKPTRHAHPPQGRIREVERHHSATPDTTEPKLAGNRRKRRVAEPPDASRSPQPTTPRFEPRSTEVSRRTNPSRLHDCCGEP
jgi:hypothetical protein